MSKPIRVGVFGVGSLGQWHARIYSESPEADLVGVYDIDPGRAREIAQRYATTAYDDMGELARQIEAASVVVPTDRHFDVFSFLAQDADQRYRPRAIEIAARREQTLGGV